MYYYDMKVGSVLELYIHSKLSSPYKDHNNVVRISLSSYRFILCSEMSGVLFTATRTSPFHRKVMFEKQWLFLEKAVGQLYSTSFEVVSGGHLEPQKAKTTESSTGKLQA